MKTNRIKWKSSWVTLPLAYQNVRKTVPGKGSKATNTSGSRDAETNGPGGDPADRQENILQPDKAEKEKVQENGRINGKPVTIQEVVTHSNRFTDMINPVEILEKMSSLHKRKGRFILP